MPPSNRADYFDIHDEADQPLAGLLVLLDKRGQPARAELHVAADTERAAAQTAVQQARDLLEARYQAPARRAQAGASTEEEVDTLESDPLPLYVLRIDQQSVVDVDLPPAPAPRAAASSVAAYSRGESTSREFSLPDAGTLLPYITAAVVGLALVLIVWAASVFLDRSSPDEELTRGEVVAGEVVDGAVDDAPDDTNDDASDVVVVPEETDTDAADTDTAAVAEPTPANAQEAAEAALDAVTNSPGAQTNNLPPSENADPSLQIGDRARMSPGLRAFLLPELTDEFIENPEANNLGVLTDDQVVTLVGGPVWREGESDTVVWWLVELEDGEQAWVVANTSQFTLLRPVE